MLHKIKLPVHSIAHGRAGDKGDVSNVSLIAYNKFGWENIRENATEDIVCLLYTSPSPRDATLSRMPSSA